MEYRTRSALSGILALQSEKYAHDKSFLSVYGYGENKKIKLTTMKTVRNSGLEIDDEKPKVNVRGCVNNEKLENNISRARSAIFEYAFCNPWDYFLTFTLDKSKYDRTDLDKFHKDVMQFIRDQNKKYNTSIKVLLVPELHSDGESWHMHGLIYGLPLSALHQFRVGDRMGKKIAEKVKNGAIVYDWTDYRKKFGWNDLEPIRSHEAVSKYITKYVNKNLAESVTELNAHLYYVSRGLNRKQVKKIGTISTAIEIVPSSKPYENDYCRIQWFDYSEDTLSQLIEAFDSQIHDNTKIHKNEYKGNYYDECYIE